MELRKVRLGEIIDEYISGDWGCDVTSEEALNGVFCIRGADMVPIADSDFTNIPLRYISNRSKNKRLLKAGDLVIEKSGGSPTQSTGRMAIVSEELIKEKKHVVCSNFCTAIRLKAGWNPLYVYYYWTLAYNSGVFFNFEGKTSGLRNLNLDLALSSIEIKQATSDEQNKLVGLLSSIDRKIALNRRMNATLEAMARQLYDYWFLQFDFPDAHGKPYKSSGGKMTWNNKLKRDIPEGWEVMPIGEILDKYPSTKRYETKDYLPVGRYPIVDQGDAFIVGYTNEEENLLRRHPAVLFGDHSTKVKYLDFDFARGADGTQVLYSSHSAICQYYLYLAVSSMQIPNPGYSRHFKYLKDMPITVPDMRTASEFERIILPISKEWTKNIFCNISLTRLRTTLLPLLMNGQVSVEEPQ